MGKMYMQFFVMLVGFMFLSANSLDITVGLTNCKNCVNTSYYQAESNNATSTIRKALVDVVMSGGGAVYLLNGTYFINAPLEIYSNTRIIGAGVDKTIIRLSNFIDRFRHPTILGMIRAASNGLLGYGCDNISITELTIDGNKANQYQDSRTSYGRYGIYTENCHNLYVSNVHVHSMQHYGMTLQGMRDTIVAKNITIKDCISTNNGWDGYEIQMTDNVIVTNCTAKNNIRHGFNIMNGVTNAKLSNILTSNNGWEYSTGVGCGINIQNDSTTNNIMMDKSVLSNDSRAAVCMVGNVNNINFEYINIDAPDTCIMLGNGTTNVYVSNVVCNSLKKKFITRVETASNITSVNNTLPWRFQSPNINSRSKNNGLCKEPGWVIWVMIMIVMFCIV
jgi:hypothetical protein